MKLRACRLAAHHTDLFGQTLTLQVGQDCTDLELTAFGVLVTREGAPSVVVREWSWAERREAPAPTAKGPARRM